MISAPRRLYGPLMAAITMLVLAWVVVVGWMALDQAIRLDRVGADLDLYVEATRRWLGGGGFYLPHQLTGPYLITDGDILYPPTTIPLFLPFLVLPGWLFLLIPAAVTGGVVVRWRPGPWSWPLMALCLAFPPTLVKLVHFNPFAWATAAVALGTIWAWPSVFALIKPSLAPFALLGIRHRAWWIAAAAAGLLAMLFLPLWPDYVVALANSRNPSGLLYSLTDAPLLLIPLLAWLARARREPRRPSPAADG